MTDQEMQVVNRERNYYAMIPNLIDDLGLSVWAFRLYGRFRRVAGDDGACWQSTKTLAAACNMSVHKVVDAKDELETAGLISIERRKNPNGGRDFDYVTIVDVWAANIAKYSQVPVGNMQVPTGNLQVPVVQRKKNPIRMPTQRRKNRRSLRENTPVRPKERDERGAKALPPYSSPEESLPVLREST